MTLEEHIKRYDDRAKSIRNAIVEKKEAQEVVELLRELKMYREVVDNKSFEIADPLDPHRHNVLVVKVTDLYNDFFDF